MTVLRDTERPRGRTPRRWWQRMVLYECQLPSLRDSDGDGIGDLQSIVDALGYHQEDASAGDVRPRHAARARRRRSC